MASALLFSCLLSRDFLFPSNKDNSSCYSLYDIYATAIQLYQKQVYDESYRIFNDLESKCYRVSHCAWYQIHCLIRLGHWRQAISKCHDFIQKEPTEANWYLLASDIYIDQKEFRFAWEELHQASLRVPSTDDAYTEVCMRKRIVSEASHIVTRVDIIDKLPRDVLCHLFHFLDLQSLVRCLRVSRCWRDFIMQSPPLWSRLDFSHATSSLRADTLRMYLQHLGRSSLTYLSLNHHQVDGDGMLMVLAEHKCRRVKSLNLNDVVCTPEIFFNILYHIGSALTHFAWCGVSIRLNDLFNQIADNCLELTQLALADCFTSLHDVPIPHTAVMRLDQFGQPLPLVLLKHIQSMSTINTLQSLELSGIHGLTIGHLAQVILRCPFLERLILKRSLVNIIPVLNIIYSGYCQKLKYLLFERNRYCRHTDQYQHHQQQQQQTMVIPLLMRPSSHTALHSTKRAWIELEIVATSQLSDQIMRRLIHDKSRLSVLNLQGNSQLSDEAFRFNDNDTTQLRRLGLKECYGITSKGLYALIAHSPLLEHVDLSCLSIVTGEIIRLLAQCPHLRTLNLSYCRLFCFDELKELIDKKQDTLEQLKIEYTNIPLDMVAFKARKIKKGII